MSALLEKVRAGGLLAPGRPVVVMYSGGRDSTCLLDLAVRIGGASSVTALHVNYGLRDAADADERHCAQLCSSLGVPFELRRPQRGSGNLQAWAREERYRAATQLALRLGADVAAGHTASDQVETILYRLASSPSRRALLGMAPREGSLVRPLLSFTREDTAAYCRSRGLHWREDDSNSSDAFARSRIRHELVPVLSRIHPGAVDNVLALAQVLRDEAAALEGLVDGVLGGARAVSLATLRELPVAVQRLIVQRLADEAAGGLAPGAARRAEEVAALGDQGTVELDIGNGLRAVAEYGNVRVARIEDGAMTPEPVPLAIPGRVRFGGQEVRCELGTFERGPGVLDRAALGSELLVRAWRSGDRMAPLGLGGHKSLQDLLTARRVPRRERGSVVVVESAGEIAWVAGVATSEQFKVTEATRQTVRLTVDPKNGAAKPRS